MNEDVCQYFKIVWDDFSDKLDESGNYNFDVSGFCDNYCDYDCDENCYTDLDKINSGCLYLFKTFFGNSDSIENGANNDIIIIQYIWVWLSYILSLKETEGISNLNDFYEKYIKDKDKYTAKINSVTGYKSYQDLINKNTEIITANNKDMSKFYDPFKVLCNMYIECNEKNKDCTKCSKYAENFINKYNELNGNSDVSRNSSYSKILSTLLTDYNNFKKYFSEKCSHCNNSITLPDIETTKTPVQNNGESSVQDHGEKTVQDNTDKSVHIPVQDNVESPVEISEAISSSSSVVSKLISVLSIFVVIPIFLGIAYKYSLFGIDKRIQRHYLRGKLKKIKKK